MDNVKDNKTAIKLKTKTMICSDFKAVFINVEITTCR